MTHRRLTKCRHNGETMLSLVICHMSVKHMSPPADRYVAMKVPLIKAAKYNRVIVESLISGLQECMK